MNRRCVVLGALGPLLGGALLCSAIAAEPPRAAAPAAAQKGAAPSGDAMQVEGGLGELDSAQVSELLKKRQPDIQHCYEELTNRLWYLGGNAQIKVRVAKSGEPRAAAVIHSTLGSYEVERCVQQVLLKLRYPAPKGGEGELTYPIEIGARNKVASWPEAKVAGLIEKKRGEFNRCQARGKPPAGMKWATAASLRLTFYVGPGGKITSAGLAADEPMDAAMAGCVLNRLQALHFEDPLGQLIKVSYDLAAQAK